MRTFKTYSRSSFQIYSTILLTEITIGIIFFEQCQYTVEKSGIWENYAVITWENNREVSLCPVLMHFQQSSNMLQSDTKCKSFTLNKRLLYKTLNFRII